MFSLFTLENGRKVKTPWLDGVLERGLILAEKWYRKNPKLAAVPEHLVLLAAMEAADVMRQLQGFKAAGFGRKAALHYAHSHLADRFMFAGIVYALASGTYYLQRDKDNPAAAPSFLGFSKDGPEDASRGPWGRPTAEKLREYYEFKVEFPGLIGPEATEHLIQATLAYDRWVREKPKGRGSKTS
jgi:hypothetical protein